MANQAIFDIPQGITLGYTLGGESFSITVAKAIIAASTNLRTTAQHDTDLTDSTDLFLTLDFAKFARWPLVPNGFTKPDLSFFNSFLQPTQSPNNEGYDMHWAAALPPELDEDLVLTWTGDWRVEAKRSTVLVGETTTDAEGVSRQTVRWGAAESNAIRFIENSVSLLENVSLVRVSDVAAFEAGQVFRDEYIGTLAQSYIIRWMKSMNIEATHSRTLISEPSDLTPYESISWTGDGGIPLQAICEISNAAITIPYICLHENSSEALVIHMAEILEAHLNPGLPCYVQYTNEAWNGSYFCNARNIVRSLREWGVQLTNVTTTGGTDAVISVTCDSTSGVVVNRPVTFSTGNELAPKWHLVLSVDPNGTDFTVSTAGFHSNEVPAVTAGEAGAGDAFWNQQWQAREATRLLKILDANTTRTIIKLGDGQLNNRATVEQFLNPSKWLEQEPDTYEDPNEFFDAIVVNPYFGVNWFENTQSGADYHALVDAGDVAGAHALRFAYMTDPASEEGIWDLVAKFKSLREITGDIPILAYEGGDHTHHGPFGGAPVPSVPIKLAHAAYVDSAYGRDEIDLFYRICSSSLDGPVMWFQNIGPHYVKDGNLTNIWTLRENVFDAPPRWERFVELSQRPQWWTPDAPPSTAVALAPVVVDQFGSLGTVDVGVGFTANRRSNDLTYSATGLPDGTSIDPQTGEIVGAISGHGVFNAIISLTDLAGNVASTPLDVTVNEVVLEQVDPIIFDGARYFQRTGVMDNAAQATRLIVALQDLNLTQSTFQTLLGHNNLSFEGSSQNNLYVFINEALVAGHQFNSGSPADILTTESPHDVIFDIDFPTGVLNVWVDGVLVWTLTDPDVTAEFRMTGLTHFAIGARSNSGTTPFVGSLSRAMLWQNPTIDVSDPTQRDMIWNTAMANNLGGQTLINFYGEGNAPTNHGVGGDFVEVTI